MKFFKYILIFTITFTSCKSSKKTTDASNVKITSAKRIVKKHIASNFNEETVDAKLKVDFKNEKQEIGLSVRMKIKKDEVIWLKGTKFITVFKAKITPNKVSFYSPYKKNYIEGDFETLKEILGFEINFNQLQNLILGQTLYDINAEEHSAALVENDYVLKPKKQPELFDILYKINQVHFKLNEQSLMNNEKKQSLNILYPNYKETDNTLFPETIQIKANQKTKASNIGITIRSIIFDEDISIPYKIPEGYQEIKL